MRVLMVSDVYFPRINGVSTSIETFRQGLAHEGVAGRPVPGDPEDRLLAWSTMCRAVDEAAASCDLIHVQTPFVAHYAGLRAARKHRLPVLATYHTLFE